MSLIVKVAQAESILNDAMNIAGVRGSLLLYSGGNDSTVLLRLFGGRATRIGHCNTGTGVPETREFVGKCISDFGHIDKFIEETPVEGKDDYETMVMKIGFPGPSMHRLAYQRLKERSLRRMKKTFHLKRGEKLVYITGVRAAESAIRAGYKRTTKIDGNVIWVNPMYYFTDQDMEDARNMFSIPENPVSKLLHISGECLCGAFAHPGELEEIKFWFPDVGRRISDLEKRAESAGLKHCKWGPTGRKIKTKSPGPLCHGCGNDGEDMFGI